MSNVQVQFKRGDTTTLNNTPITDGMIYFNTDNQHIYMDNGTTSRLEYYNNMSNFMDDTIISNLVSKTNNMIKNPDVIDRIIGDSYIGDDVSIIEAVDDLQQNKALFQTIWENPNPQAFTTKTVITQGVYPFYLILFGKNLSGAIAQEEINNCIMLNNSTIFTYFGYPISNDIYVYGRKITATSNSNTTTFTFGQYGSYINGIINDYNTDSQDNFIPYKIIGISNT